MRLAVLCTDDPHQIYLVSELERRFGLVGVLLERNASQRRRLWRRGRYRDWSYRLYHSWRGKLSGKSRYRAEYFLPLAKNWQGWPESTVEVESINNKKARNTVTSWQPDVTIVCGTGVISRKMLALTGFTINIHGGCLPEYKGNHCVFFAFREERFDKIGGTLHQVTPELDGGPILEVVRPSVYPNDNDETLYSKSVHQTMLRLFEYLDAMQHGWRPTGNPQPSNDRILRHRDRTPWVDAGLGLRRLLGRHKTPCIPRDPSAVPALEAPQSGDPESGAF